MLHKNKLFRKIAFNVPAILIITVLISCQQQREISITRPCSTRYPIVLVHGLSFRDDVPIIKYWSRLPKVLEHNGAKIYLSNTDAMNSHVENAILLQERILEILDNTKAEKVNIIAHSKGGLEARYMISKLDMADKVASLTTLATPHRGSPLADTILYWLNKKKWLDRVISGANFYARIIGDKSPDALTAAQNLTVGYVQNFNQSVPDVPQVYYQSFGGMVTKDYPMWLVRFQEKIIAKSEGENDSNVSLKSYQWGNFRGVVKSDQDFGVSHYDIIGMKFVSKQSTFDSEKFIVDIVKDLKVRGF